MADHNKLELVVEVDVNKANASIKSVNTGLSSMEQAASKAARGASVGIDGMTASMVKGAAAGNSTAESIKKALEFDSRTPCPPTLPSRAECDQLALQGHAFAHPHSQDGLEGSHLPGGGAADSLEQNLDRAVAAYVLN